MTERGQQAHGEAQVSLRQRLVPVTNNDNPLSLRPGSSLPYNFLPTDSLVTGVIIA